MYISELKDIFLSLGICKGDSILVSSEAMKLIIQLSEADKNATLDRNRMSKILDDVIECLQSVVGEDGTLLFPTFYWGFCKGKTFDYVKTLGQTGILSNRALARPDFKRTTHPIYSFAVWGKGKDELTSLENKSSFGDDSPFEWLHRNGGKNLVIDAAGYFTFLHYIEEKYGVSYRYLKDFTADYKDEKGEVSTRTYSMYVRDLDLNFIASNEGIEQVLLEHNAMKVTVIADIRFGIIPFKEAYDCLLDEIEFNQSKNLMKWL